ncbi:MAG: tripartite tricarboxylate transporter substrate binding protein [Burkholderiaceae bacterium]|nr:tripartite tricarboxylate transporter substrate binding protein [Burkholderiaceae bacterium]MDO9090485.1 tripartite tricarboxylate transporter substrate binding protein [Burkholderiaceae bacterium]
MNCYFKAWRAAAAVSLLATTVGAWAQAWPSKPIRLVVPFAVGGVVDLTARETAQVLSARLGQPVIVENRAGNAGMIGVDFVAKAAPDGYTLVMASAGTIAINPHLFKAMPYDPVKDLVAVAPVVQGINIMVVPASSPVKNVREFIAAAKAAPGKINFGSAGTGASDHMATELFANMAGIKITNVPYKGGGPALIDLLAGTIDLIFSSLPPAIGHVKSGRLRALGVTSANRLEVLPDVPTVAEAGVPGYESVAWYGLFAPANTPASIVSRINAETAATLQNPDLRRRFLEGGLIPFSSSPQAFASYVAAETDKWGKVVRANGIKAD